MPSIHPTINFVIDPDLLAKIEDFRFMNRFASRAGAIKWLLAAALAEGPEPSVENRDERDKYLSKRTRRRR